MHGNAGGGMFGCYCFCGAGAPARCLLTLLVYGKTSESVCDQDTIKM